MGGDPNYLQYPAKKNKMSPEKDHFKKDISSSNQRFFRKYVSFQ